jgi:tRNA(Ile)-lysidine synthetase-like protein
MREFNESILESLDAGLAVVDTRDRVLRWNRSLEQLHGATRAEAVGRTLEDLFGSSFLDAVKTARSHSPQGGTFYGLPLTVRRRRPGDLFQPLGAPGTRKIKKMLIDLKIPAAQRDNLPIVCDGTGIIWVSGCRRSERARLCAHTRDYVVVELIKAGNSQ